MSDVTQGNVLYLKADLETVVSYWKMEQRQAGIFSLSSSMAGTLLGWESHSARDKYLSGRFCSANHF